MDAWNIVPILKSIDRKVMKDELLMLYNDCTTRCCFKTAKWAAQLLYTLRDIKTLSSPMQNYPIDETYLLTVECFRSREYLEASRLAQTGQGPEIGFVGRLALYMYCQKKVADSAYKVDKNIEPDSLKKTEHMLNELAGYYRENFHKLDAFDLLLYGSLLATLRRGEEALSVLLSSLELCPYLWNTWQELALLVKDKSHLQGLELPNAWTKVLFYIETLTRLHMPEDSVPLIHQVLAHCPFLECFLPLSSLLARGMASLRDAEGAISLYERILECWPESLPDLAEYSSVLYTTEDVAKLKQVAMMCHDIDKYNVHTCLATANLLSFTGNHKGALNYLQRTLTVDPKNAAVWVLIGHEYIEAHQPRAAINAYLRAIEIDPRDFKTWYGLGQAYEFLKQYQMSIYYFSKAHTLRPNDSRILVSLGGNYEELEKVEEAGKCYWKAHCVGDAETLALLKLANMYERMGREEQSAVTFRSYLDEIGRSGLYQNADYYHAYMSLARYHLKRQNWEQVTIAAKVCVQHPTTRTEAQLMLANLDRINYDNSCA